jgi:hypothetical protein
MYRCEPCGAVSRYGQALTRHTIYRETAEPGGGPAGSILREVPVCPSCRQALEAGTPLRLLAKDPKRYHDEAAQSAVKVKAPARVIPFENVRRASFRRRS